MLAYIEALAAVATHGTMTKAATKLRVTQSAVSKRIAALEVECGEPLVETLGRTTRLTPRGERLVRDLRPLLAELRQALARERAPAGDGAYSVGVSESILASWGAAACRQAAGKAPLELHAHRGPVVAERVSGGEYAFGLLAGAADLLATTPRLVARELAREPMVLIPHTDAPIASLRLITIEERSGTWAALAQPAARQGLVVTQRVESFFAAARLALEGYGHGLVPRGVARALGIRDGGMRAVRGLARPISLMARTTTLSRPGAEAFAAAMAVAVRDAVQ